MTVRPEPTPAELVTLESGPADAFAAAAALARQLGEILAGFEPAGWVRPTAAASMKGFYSIYT